MSDFSDESRIIERAARGDREAFGELALRHQAALRGYISRFISRPEEVFDLAQETFIDAYRALPRFDAALDFAAWLRGIASNVVREHLRSERRSRARQLKVFEESLRRWQADQLERPGSSQDRLVLLQDCVEHLDPESRDMVTKRYFEGQDLEAIATFFRKSAGALAMQFLRIRTSLAQCVRGKLEGAR